jgi:hypothetical protein
VRAFDRPSKQLQLIRHCGARREGVHEARGPMHPYATAAA